MAAKELKVTLKDGEKESSITLSEFNEDHQLAVIDGFFKFFDVKVDFKEMIEVYRRSGKEYKEFYDKLDKQEENKEDRDIKREFEEGYGTIDKEDKSEDEKSDDYKITGIRIGKLGNKAYKCRYKCECGDKGNHYIEKYRKTVTCWECQRILDVQPATENGDPVDEDNLEQYQDSYQNFYVAGLQEPEYKFK